MFGRHKSRYACLLNLDCKVACRIFKIICSRTVVEFALLLLTTVPVEDNMHEFIK